MKILLVEDEKSISKLIKRGLEMNNFQVEPAYDGAEALKLARNNTYNLIIMDVMMPKITGIEATKRIREMNIKTPILMLTARDAPEEHAEGWEAGADKYLVKPFAFCDLLACVNGLIKKKGA